jgi:hypothetical protein
MNFSFHFADFLVKNGFSEDVKQPSPKNKIYINAAGKNFGAFDLPYLQEKTDLNKFVKIRHRILDVGPLYMQIGDEAVPGLSTCLKRIGLEGTIAHTAVEDSIDVIKLVRYKLLGASYVS